MNDEKLFTISTLAKISNTKVKALRYYEKIGILVPTFINPENGYRFYSHHHIYLVEAIRLCAELNIPLNEFKKYVAENGTQIQVSLLIAEGIEKAKKKISEIQNTLKILEAFQEDVNESEIIQKETMEKTIAEKDYWLVSYSGLMNSTEYFSLLANAYANLGETELKIADKEADGMVLFIEKGKQTPYIFIELKKQSKNRAFNNIKRLSSAAYLQKTTTVTDIKKVPDLFSDISCDHDFKVIFMKQLYTKTLKTNGPIFEIDCSLSPFIR